MVAKWTDDDRLTVSGSKRSLILVRLLENFELQFVRKLFFVHSQPETLGSGEKATKTAVQNGAG